MLKRVRTQRGSALLETAITIPLVLLVTISIFEFGRAYQTWQVMTNAAREGARVSVLPDATDADVTNAVRNYMKSGKLPKWDTATITMNRMVPFGGNTASQITITYSYDFMVLNPVVQLVKKGSNLGKGPTTMTSSALMRNES